MGGNRMSDAVGEKRDEVRKVREFLYVDHERIRSYYSQINRGVIETIISRGGDNVAGEVGIRLLGLAPRSLVVTAGSVRNRVRSRI